ncbi:MAG: glycosyltransferase family 9 protein [Vampirovibrionales bacterium]|nr:glycosyltransferase family 9 protein [Vampirovibrionales bacterium]
MNGPFPLPTEKPRVLLVRLSAHGDVVQTLPVLGLIKQQYPNAYVGWLVEKAAAPLLEGNPLIDHLHVVDRKRWLKTLRTQPWNIGRVWREISALRQELKGYTYSLDVQGLLKSAVWPWLAGIPNRYGYQGAREQASRFYTDPLPPFDRTNATITAALEFAALAEASLGLNLTSYRNNSALLPYPIATPTPQQVSKVNECLEGLEKNLPLIGIAPATQWQSKRWPNEYWLEVIQTLSALANVVVLGAESDRPTIEPLLEALEQQPKTRVLNWVGKTPLESVYAVASRLDVLVAPDSLWLHVGQAVSANPKLNQGKPYLVGVFGPTATGRTGPVGSQHQTLSTQLACQPCFQKICPLDTTECLTSLRPQQVLETISQQLAKVQAEVTV